MPIIVGKDGVDVFRGRVETQWGTTIPQIDNADWYGVMWDETPNVIMEPDCIRIGNMAMHQSLPIQSEMRGCLLNDDGTVNYWLHPKNWAVKADGITPSKLDGTDGQVMVYMPEFYFYDGPAPGGLRVWAISKNPLPNFIRQMPQYISAYEAVVNRTAPYKLWSIMNMATEYRGGTNNASYDGNHNSLLGRPVTNMSRGAFRTYARNRGAGWEMYNYFAHKSLLILFTIEYATRNSQKAFNPALDLNGYRQGGLGIGCTNLDSGSWGPWNGYNPFLPCGLSNGIGNGTGESAPYPVYAAGAYFTTGIRYRGIENPFGHIYKIADGINYNGTTKTTFVSENPTYWQDANYDNMVNVGVGRNTSSWTYKMLQNEIMPATDTSSTVGAARYWCDHFWSGSGLCDVRFGGHAAAGAYAGLAYADARTAPTNVYAYGGDGSRLCFLI